ncbi:MAG: SET domain-containing protein-lysine N-methyltransferase [Verrucomicrobiales bacterium]|nr:SET domain-containing protein-lysine N-methyltransferase [Verrucomicrobiales bacterium]
MQRCWSDGFSRFGLEWLGFRKGLKPSLQRLEMEVVWWSGIDVWFWTVYVSMGMRLSYLSPRCKASTSRIHGTGLFAVSGIREGEVVAVKGGYILGGEEWAGLEKELGPAEIQIADDLYIAPTRMEERDGAMLYSNHSCDPNIGIQGQIVFVAMRDIAAGEELTHDWATTDNEDYSMSCNCGSPHCRGTVTGQDWRMPELQVRYAGWFAWHIQRAIEGMRDEVAG